MSDDERPARPAEHEEPKDEVEAHHHRRVAANDEPAKEDEGDDEVEAHGHFRKA